MDNINEEQKKQLYRARCINSINKTEGWQALLDIIEDIKKEDYEKYLHLTSQELTTRKGLSIKGRQNSFIKLFEKFEDLETVSQRHSKQG